LALLWWAEDAQVFVNGELVQSGDLFDCNVRILVTPAVVHGEKITLTLRLVSPGHDPGALVRSQLIYEPADPREIDPGFVADELTILWQYLQNYPDSPELIDKFKAQINLINWSAVHQRETFNQSLGLIRENLRSLLPSVPNIPAKISLLGHAHLDMAWLWPISETWTAAQGTFTSVLNLMEEFPDLTFGHSTAALYEWIEIHRPDLFLAIQKQVKAGRWEILAGLWVEPELNIISGESIVRQIFYGQRYCLAKFGQLAPVAWLPDTFGFCWQLPQLLTQGGIEYFVTQKLRWNDTTEFPYSLFWWESPDGSRIFSLMSAPIGKDIDGVEMAEYAIDWQQKTGINHALWLPGVGDHGGGPTREMLEVAEKWQYSRFIPQLDFTTSEAYLQQLYREKISKNLPIWQNELYLEFHRGCYTTYGRQKQWNRRCEDLLYQAELFSSLAQIIADLPYPQNELETAWKQVLFNQFHDILPGSSIPEVYEEVNPSWQASQQVATNILDGALKAIGHQIDWPQPPRVDAKPIVVFNSLNWSRSEVVTVDLATISAAVKSWKIYNHAGEEVRSQLTENSLLFYAADIPSIGYAIFWLVGDIKTDDADGDTVGAKHSRINPPDQAENYLNECFAPTIENDLLRVIVDPETGNLQSIFDKVNQREVLSGAGNQLQAFQDSGQYWDAWNIDPNYAQHPLNPPVLKEIQWQEYGPIQWRLRVIRLLENSEFIQDYILQIHSPILKIETSVDWQTPHVMVKAAFPLNVVADMATYEMPCGAIARPTNPQTPAEKAQWEVPALHWADLTENLPKIASEIIAHQEAKFKAKDTYGVSLLNDCKYGYDAQPNQLRLTLLRGSTWPDPNADFYHHQFTYGIYPHAGSWQEAKTVRRGYEFNQPLLVQLWENCAEFNAPIPEKKLPAQGSFLDLSAENLILMAFKPTDKFTVDLRADNGADNGAAKAWILRCYECHGEEAEIQLTSDLGVNVGVNLALKIDGCLDLLERAIAPTNTQANNQIFPWQVRTFSIII
jgi:alpha-mannosidase